MMRRNAAGTLIKASHGGGTGNSCPETAEASPADGRITMQTDLTGTGSVNGQRELEVLADYGPISQRGAL
jgi:hypothetical protein